MSVNSAMPPVHQRNLPSKDWFDKLQARPHSRDTQNRVVKDYLTTQKPVDFMKNR
jgi:predicted P-loop ATPase